VLPVDAQVQGREQGRVRANLRQQSGRAAQVGVHDVRTEHREFARQRGARAERVRNHRYTHPRIDVIDDAGAGAAAAATPHDQQHLVLAALEIAGFGRRPFGAGESIRQDQVGDTHAGPGSGDACSCARPLRRSITTS
jgi:hypothetical protein